MEQKFDPQKIMPDLIEKVGIETVRRWVGQFDLGYAVFKRAQRFDVWQSFKGKGLFEGSMISRSTTPDHFAAYERWCHWFRPEPYPEVQAIALFNKLKDRLQRREVNFCVRDGSHAHVNFSETETPLTRAHKPKWKAISFFLQLVQAIFRKMTPQGRLQDEKKHAAAQVLCQAGYAMSVLDTLLTYLPRQFFSGAGVKTIELFSPGEIVSGGSFDAETGSIRINSFGVAHSRQTTVGVLFRTFTAAWGHRIDEILSGKIHDWHTIFLTLTPEHLKSALQFIAEEHGEQRIGDYVIETSLGSYFADLLAIYINHGVEHIKFLKTLTPGTPAYEAHHAINQFIKDYVFRGRRYQ